MKLSETVDINENNWNGLEYELSKKFIDLMSQKIGIDLYEKSPSKNPLDTYEYYKVWLLNYYEDELKDTLESIGVSFKHFKNQLIYSFILSVSRGAKNIEILTKVFIDKGIFKSFKKIDNEYIIEYDEGEISFSIFYDNAEDDVRKYMDKLGNTIVDACHIVTLEMMRKYPTLKGVTSISNRGLNQKYYHSFNLDQDYVIDLTGNIIMKKYDYYKLLEVEELNIIDYQEYLNTKDKSVDYDESGTLFPLLRCAVYEQYSKGNFEK